MAVVSIPMCITERKPMNRFSFSDSNMLSGLLLLFFAASYTVYREAAPFMYFGASQNSHLSTLAGREPKPALSAFGNRLYLNRCFEVLSNPLNRLENMASVLSTAENCRKLSTVLAERNHTDSYAYAILAYANFTLSDPVSALQKLEQSRMFAPSEAWLSSLRLRQFREYRDLVSGSQEYNTSRDIVTLGKTGVGRQWLAGWYKSEENARVLIVQSIDVLTDLEKAAFLGKVRSLN